jgi:hypothetical protein
MYAEKQTSPYLAYLRQIGLRGPLKISFQDFRVYSHLLGFPNKDKRFTWRLGGDMPDI